MIPVILRDRIYVFKDKTPEEVLELIEQEGIDSPKVRATALLNISDNISILNSFVKKMEFGFYQVGDGYTIKEIKGIDDLNRVVGPDGKRYACQEDLEQSVEYSSNSPAVVSVEEVPIYVEEVPIRVEENPVSVGKVPMHTDKAPIKVGLTPIARDVAPTVKSIKIHRVAAPARRISRKKKVVLSTEAAKAKHVDDKHVEAVAFEEVPVPVVEKPTYTAEQKSVIDLASFLDNECKKYPNVLEVFDKQGRADVCSFLTQAADTLSDVKKQFLEQIEILRYGNGEVDSQSLDFALQEDFSVLSNKSSNLYDALLTYPVFSTIVSKRDLNKRFSLSYLDGAEFVRVCPVGVSKTAELMGFTKKYPITSHEISTIEHMIDENYPNFDDLSAEEKTDIVNKCLNDIFAFANNDYKFDTSDYTRIGLFFESLEKKYKVPMFFDNETKEVAWPANDVFVMSNIHPEKSLETQVTAIYDELNKKTVSMTPITVTPTVEFQGEQNIVDPTIVQPVAVVQKDAAEHVIVPPAEEPGKKVGSINPNIKLFDSLLRGNSVFTGDSLSVYDGTGTVISKQIVNPRVNAAPEHRTVVEFGLGIGSGINPGSVSIGGINPLKPKAFFDSSGHEWESKESYDTVMREIFGSDYEQDLGDDLGSRRK